MKKHIMMLLLGMAAPPVLAAKAYYPISVGSVHTSKDML
jgi:hypothetical protein